MPLTDGDRAWLETKFQAVHTEIREQGSKVHKLDTRMIQLEAGSPHKCDEAIKAHEEGSWSHNPYKATGLFGGILGIVEGVRAFFHK